MPRKKNLRLKNAFGKPKPRYKGSRHSERCPKCKNILEKLLAKTYGEAIKGYNVGVGVRLEYFKDTQCYKELSIIYNILKKSRGYETFLRSKTLRPCDFFIPKPGFIVELDESQHFTPLRKIALEHYPKELKLGFNKKRWIDLCVQINRLDNDPPYRDEQRAWYDTIRDFLPLIKKGMMPM